jgi:hypothetical protein
MVLRGLIASCTSPNTQVKMKKDIASGRITRSPPTTVLLTNSFNRFILIPSLINYLKALNNIPEIKPTINTINIRKIAGISNLQNNICIVPTFIFCKPNIKTITINIIPIIFLGFIIVDLLKYILIL